MSLKEIWKQRVETTRSTTHWSITRYTVREWRSAEDPPQPFKPCERRVLSATGAPAYVAACALRERFSLGEDVFLEFMSWRGSKLPTCKRCAALYLETNGVE